MDEYLNYFFKSEFSDSLLFLLNIMLVLAIFLITCSPLNSDCVPINASCPTWYCVIWKWDKHIYLISPELRINVLDGTVLLEILQVGSDSLIHS